jgi:hypothetical protein
MMLENSKELLMVAGHLITVLRTAARNTWTADDVSSTRGLRTVGSSFRASRFKSVV